MRLRTLTISFLICYIFLISAVIGSANTETISFKTGNAAIGSRDPMITFKGENWDCTWAAQGIIPSSGSPLQNALVVQPVAGWWVTPPGDVKWVTSDTYLNGNNIGSPYGSNLYELRFNMPDQFYTPQISVSYASDDVGSVYLNGHRFSGFVVGFWSFSSATLTDSLAFNQGTNVLQFRVANAQANTPAGLAFYGSVAYETSPVPEPSSILALLCGIGGLGGILKLKKR